MSPKALFGYGLVLPIEERKEIDNSMYKTALDLLRDRPDFNDLFCERYGTSLKDGIDESNIPVIFEKLTEQMHLKMELFREEEEMWYCLITDSGYYINAVFYNSITKEFPINTNTEEIDKKLKDFCEKTKLNFNPLWVVNYFED
jgi:hypothetical protein